MECNAYEFWKRVDAYNPCNNTRELCKRIGLDYWNTMQQRSKEIIPKPPELLKISKALGKTIDFLLTGEERRDYSPRIDRIARECQFYATNEDLMLIERILRIPSDYIAVEKKENTANTSSGIA